MGSILTNVHDVARIEVTTPRLLMGAGCYTADVRISTADGALFEVTCFADRPELVTPADQGMRDFGRKALDITQAYLPPDSGITEHEAFKQLLALIDTHPAMLALSLAAEPTAAQAPIEPAPVAAEAAAEDLVPF